jgi:GT2 family glycosyltransferase
MTKWRPSGNGEKFLPENDSTGSVMRASLILCSKNGGARLKNCLSAINAMDIPPELDLVLVDNGSTDGVSPGIMQQFVAQARISCRILEVTEPGNSAGRNAGIAAAQGDLLLFIDDDCYVHPDFAREWLAVFSAEKIGFGSGMILKYAPENSDLGCNESPLVQRIAPRAFVERGFIQGSNMAFRRDCLQQAGSFDPRFGAGTLFAGEEWDVVLRASAAGWAGGYFPGPKVKHDHNRKDDGARDRLLFYDFGAGAVYAKHMKGAAFLRNLGHFLRDAFRLRRDGRRLRSLFKGYAAFRHLPESAG